MKHKSNISTCGNTLAVLLLVALAASIQTSRATVLASDNFTEDPNGTFLDTTTTPVGGLAWGDGGLSQIYNNGVTPTSAGAVTRYVAGVPFSAGSNSSFSVQADLDPQSVNPGYWSALGFGTTTGTQDFTFTAAPLWALLTNQGNWGIFVNSVGDEVASGGNGTGPAFTFNPTNQYNTLNLAFNTSTDVATLTINGTVVYSGVQSTVVTGNIAVAGVDEFFQNSSTTFPGFTNFSLSAVPEPTTTALCGAAAMVFLARCIKRRRE